MTWQHTKYTCKTCGKEFPRWLAVTTDDDAYVFHTDSLQNHFINTPKCNAENAQRMKRDREARRQQEYYEMTEYL